MGICESTKNNDNNSSKNLKQNENNHKKKIQDNEEPNPKPNPVSSENFQLAYSRPKHMKDIDVDISKLTFCKPGTPLDHYSVEKMLGEGSYGQVFKVRNKDLNISRAMKKLSLSNFNSKADPEKEREILNEIEMLKSLDHPNIVKVFEFYTTKDGYFIITEFCKGGELFDKIVNNPPFEEEAAAYILYQILSAVFYCHNKNIIHRDLKPENILVEDSTGSKGKGFLNVKIIDFGTAKIFEKGKAEKKVIGSSYYIAPEVLLKKYTEMCDIWSCGVILYILLSGKAPFSGNDEEIMEKVKIGKFDLKGDVWIKASKEVKDLISKMLEKDYLNKRYSAQKCLSHKWFKKFKMREQFTNIGIDKLKQSIENIKRFKSENKLQQAALAFLVHNCLHLPEIKDLAQIFRGLDKNGDGQLTKDEMKESLAKIYGIADVDDEVDEIFKNVDNDNNGYIEYEEYIRASIDKKTILTENVLKFTFKFFDSDNSGQISCEEIAAVLFKNEDDETKEMFSKEIMKQIDSDENSEINYQEFKDMMIKLLV